MAAMSRPGARRRRIAVWWLGSTRLALDHGTDASRCAADALYALLLVRGMALAVLSVRVGALRGWRPGVDGRAGTGRTVVARRGACMVRQHDARYRSVALGGGSCCWPEAPRCR